ncbi:hypothetical protein [Mycoplasma elephantis]|uniref:SLAC1 family transporter n=1 Tax=Mycoplasma elephantis TaxID=114882 RepID=UPI00048A3610|nr:hypothetical protein [Mycoplasma elephantis]
MKNFKEKCKSIPLAVNTVALGSMGIASALASLTTNIYKNKNNANLPLSGLYTILAIQIFCILICIFYLIMLCFRYYSLGIKQIKLELLNPEIVGPVAVTLLDFCTLANSFGWIYSTFLKNELKWWFLLSVNVYIFFVIALQIAYFIFFIKKIWSKKESWLGEIYSSWFVPLIGVSITPGYVNNLGDILPLLFWQLEWFIGFGTFIIMYPLVLYKFLFKPHSHPKNIPSMAIYSSPANMLSIGFLSAFDPFRTKNTNMTQNLLNNQVFYDIFVIIMYCWAALSVCLFFAIFVKSMMLHQYSHSWGALTFPSSISATGNALFAYYLFFNSHITIYWTSIAFSVFLLLISFSITIFVNIKYAIEIHKVFWINKKIDACNASIH